MFHICRFQFILQIFGYAKRRYHLIISIVCAIGILWRWYTYCKQCIEWKVDCFSVKINFACVLIVCQIAKWTNSPFPYTNDVVVDDENGHDETGLSDAGKMWYALSVAVPIPLVLPSESECEFVSTRIYCDNLFCISCGSYIFLNRIGW